MPPLFSALWSLRCEDEIDGPTYENNDGLFTINLHHGGWVKTKPKQEYVYGNVTYFDNCNKDTFSLLEVDDMVELLGYSGKQEYMSIDEDGCLFKVENDMDLMKLLGLGKRIVSIYVVHLYVPDALQSNVNESQITTCQPTVETPHFVPFEPCQSFNPFEGGYDSEGAAEVGTEGSEGGGDSEGSEDGGVSEGSIDLDYFLESDYDIEDDDDLLDENTDRNEEFEGVRERLVNDDTNYDVDSEDGCLRDDASLESSSDEENVQSKWLGDRYLDRIRSNPHIPVAALQEHIRAELKVNVSFHKVYRAKKYAFDKIYGSMKEQYSRIHDYGAELLRTNPGPLIGMDGCHLKGVCKGILLAAVGVDANNSLYPLAFAVVESENKDSWSWFIKLLKDDINFTNSYHWAFITDKQKGLMPALAELCPNSKHRCCVRHLYNNFKGQHKGLVLKDQLYECARATTVEEFGEKMKELKKMDFDAYDWLAEKPPTQWSKSHFQTFIKSDMLLNNLCESFNNMILDARDKPIISMFERIMCRLMRRIHVNREKMMSLSDSLLCPKIEKILEKIKGDAASCQPEWSGTPKFEVNGLGGRFVCDLDAGTCACRRWDLTGIPCKHAVAAIYYFGMEPEEFVNKCYHKQTYIDCYSNHLLPLNGHHLWLNMGIDHISPPSYCVVKGRATKGARRLEEGEKQNKKGVDPYKLGKKHQQSLKCGNCGSVGHNKRKCKEPLKGTATVKKPRGRPRKPTVEGETSNTQAITKRKRQPKKNTKPPVKRTFQAQVTFEPVQQGTQINN